MKRSIAYILMVVSIAAIHYSLKTYADDQKPIKGSEFIKSYVGKDIKDLIGVLGKPNEAKQILMKEARPGSEEMIYTWEWNEIDKLPVKLIHDLKEGTNPYYVDFIRSKTVGGEITAIYLKHRNKFVIP